MSRDLVEALLLGLFIFAASLFPFVVSVHLGAPREAMLAAFVIMWIFVIAVVGILHGRKR